MHDTDMAGILYFPRMFRLAHDALEDFLADNELNYEILFQSSPFTFVIVHAEADYLLPLLVGEQVTVHLSIAHIGTTSFEIRYRVYRDEILVGMVKTVHVTLERVSRIKIPIPEEFRHILQKYYNPESKAEVRGQKAE
jgi:1,4-dihydroxy-2-naphthoyl-CoA hydrolase